MSSFPVAAEEFYALRDDRTNRCSGGRHYQNADCVVYVSPVVASTPAGQVMLLVAANLLSRWCRKVTIMLTPTKAHAAIGFGTCDLGKLIIDQMRDADPFGDFRIKESSATSEQIVLCVGDGAAD